MSDSRFLDREGERATYGKLLIPEKKLEDRRLPLAHRLAPARGFGIPFLYKTNEAGSGIRSRRQAQRDLYSDVEFMRILHSPCVEVSGHLTEN